MASQRQSNAVRQLNRRFLHGNWGLETPAARKLYHEVTVPLRNQFGINDPHTHLSAPQIVKNEPFSDLISLMYQNKDPLAPNLDHYLAQAFTNNGVPEKVAYGDATPHEMWIAFAEAFPKFAGNHAHTWAHMELRQNFGIKSIISPKTAQRIWEEASEKLKGQEMLPQSLLRNAKVRVLCTTDDPIDDLEYHAQAQKAVPDTKILPTFRPDAYFNIQKGHVWEKAVRDLCHIWGTSPTLDGLVEALEMSHDHFASFGCIASDHGLLEPYGKMVDYASAKEIFNSVMNETNSAIAVEKGILGMEKFIPYMMHQVAGMNAKKHWVTQFHFGGVRNYDQRALELYGPDRGFDVISSNIDVEGNLKYLINEYANPEREYNTRIVLYSLNCAYYPVINAITRAERNVFQGVPWWFSDTFQKIREQTLLIAQEGFVSKRAGMLCDGRKLSSLRPRFDLADRADASAIGYLVDQGLMPYENAPAVIEGLAYGYQARLFGFSEEPLAQNGK
jgi:glucuronate isomerase